MAKSKPRRRNPGRRPRCEPGVSPDQVHAEAAAEITAKFEQIARSREQDHLGPATNRGNEAVSLGIELRGAHVADYDLVSRTGTGTLTELIAIHASVHPEKPDCVVIRVDGWNGHLLLILPRDRAGLLVKKLEQAIESSHARTARKCPPSPEKGVDVIVDVNKRPAGSRKYRLARSKRRDRVIKGVLEATDQALDGLVGNEAEEDEPENM